MFICNCVEIKLYIGNKLYAISRSRLNLNRHHKTLSSFFVPSILIASLNSYLRQAMRTLDRSLVKWAEHKVRVLAVFITPASSIFIALRDTAVKVEAI